MESGDIYRNGQYVCTIRPNGDIFHNGEYLGTIRESGDIFRNGEYLGTIRPDGDIFHNGEYLGTVRPDGDIFRNGAYLGTFYGDGNGEEAEPEEAPEPPAQEEPGPSLSASLEATFSLAQTIAATAKVALPCLLVGALLAVVTGAASHLTVVYAALLPWEPAFALLGVGSVAVLLGAGACRLRCRRKVLTVLGRVAFFLASVWFFGFRLGLLALWGLPAGFLGGEEYRASISAGLSGCPAARAVFAFTSGWMKSFGWLDLSRGLSGVLRSAEGLIRSCLSIGLLGLPLALLIIPATLTVAALLILLGPVACFLIPLLPGLLLPPVIGPHAPRQK